MTKHRNKPAVRIPQGRAPLPVAGQVTKDDPTSPQLDALNTPSQLDPRSPMEDNAAPSRLDFETLKYRVETQAVILARLIQLLPAGAQGEYAPLLEYETVIADAARAEA